MSYYHINKGKATRTLRFWRFRPPETGAARPAHRRRERICHRSDTIFVALHKNKEKFSARTTKMCLTLGTCPAILTERLCESRAYYARKREIARVSEVTFVEYVRCRKHIRHAIGRLKPVFVHAYIACTGFDRPSGRFCFSVTA